MFNLITTTNENKFSNINYLFFLNKNRTICRCASQINISLDWINKIRIYIYSHLKKKMFKNKFSEMIQQTLPWKMYAIAMENCCTMYHLLCVFWYINQSWFGGKCLLFSFSSSVTYITQMKKRLRINLSVSFFFKGYISFLKMVAF
jgi:hypothetical protein